MFVDVLEDILNHMPLLVVLKKELQWRNSASVSYVFTSLKCSTFVFV